jgi:hypothetical protein
MIRMELGKKFGKRLYKFTVEGETFFDAIMESERLAFASVPCCGVCESDNLKLAAHLVKGETEDYKYVKILCLNCKASLTMGRPKRDRETYYLRKNETGAYDWKADKGYVPEKSIPQNNIITHESMSSGKESFEDIAAKVKHAASNEEDEECPF